MKSQIEIRSVARLLTVCAVVLAAGLLIPAYSTAGQDGARTEERAKRSEERAQEREARRVAREEEREARRKEREARRNARHSAGPSSGQAAEDPGTDSPPAESGVDPSGGTGHACRPTIEASATHVVAGETVTLSGTLGCPAGADTAVQQVTVYQHQEEDAAGADGADVTGTVTAEAGGSFTMTSPALDTNTVFQVREGRHAARVAVKVAPLVTLAMVTADASATSTTKAPKHPRVTFTGTVDPVNPGSLVVLQVAYAGESWRTVAVGRVASNGAYSFAHTFKSSAAASVRAIVHGKRLNVAGISEVLSYTPPQPASPPAPGAPTTTG